MRRAGTRPELLPNNTLNAWALGGSLLLRKRWRRNAWGASVADAHPGYRHHTLQGRDMSNAIAIRSVTREDFDQWLPLWEGYNTFYGRSGATTLPFEITQMTWGRFFDPYEPVHALVAESEGQLLGLTHYLYHRSTTAIVPSCYLQDLFTQEAARGKGVGKALINGVYERARAAGAARVYWQTHETNLTAMKLYDSVAERSGFLVYRKLF
jgi:GNAT superfamily N-acetyltransferase